MKPITVIGIFLTALSLATVFQTFDGSSLSKNDAAIFSGINGSPVPLGSPAASPDDPPPSPSPNTTPNTSPNTSPNASPNTSGSRAPATSVSPKPTVSANPSPKPNVVVGVLNWLGGGKSTGPSGKCVCNDEIVKPASKNDPAQTAVDSYISSIENAIIDAMSNGHFPDVKSFIESKEGDGIQRFIAGIFGVLRPTGKQSLDLELMQKFFALLDEIKKKYPNKDSKEARLAFIKGMEAVLAGGTEGATTEESAEKVKGAFKMGCNYICEQYTTETSCLQSPEKIITDNKTKADSVVATAQATYNANPNIVNKLKLDIAKDIQKAAQLLKDAIDKIVRDWNNAMARYNNYIRQAQGVDRGPGDGGMIADRNPGNPGPKPTLPPFCSWVKNP